MKLLHNEGIIKQRKIGKFYFQFLKPLAEK